MNALRYLTACVLALLGMVVAESEAFAFTGYVSGNYSIWNKNGNFCDSAAQDCTGSYYPKASSDTWQPFLNAHAEVWQGANVIGQGSTDGAGHFVMSWTSSDLTTQAYVRWFTQQKDGRFTVENTAGQRVNNGSGTFTLVNGTTSGSPQNVGSWFSGSSANPDPSTNVYWALELEWRTTFNLVGALQTAFTNVEVRGFADNQPSFLGTCTTSCAQGSTKRIQFDAAAGFSPQGRAMHEAGHIASYLMNPFHGFPFDYSYPSTGGGGGWSLTSAEWGTVSFEEGFATFSADNTLWAPSATHPTSCLSASSCPDNSSTNLETTHHPYATNNCDLANNEARWPLSDMRFFWDVYDAVNDADSDTMQEGWDCFSCMYTNIANYPAGVGADQIDEPWSSTTYTTLDNRDGRGARSYWHNYTLSARSTVGVLRTDNCDPLLAGFDVVVRGRKDGGPARCDVSPRAGNPLLTGIHQRRDSISPH